MKKYHFVWVLLLIIVACSPSVETNTAISGNIQGLKKGTLYLQRLQDSSLVNLDSVEIKGEAHFTFNCFLEGPEVLYLYLTKEDQNDINDRIAFFAEPGAIQVNTKWNTFDANAEITGSTSHDLYSEFTEMMSKFNIRELEIAQAMQRDTLAFDSLQTMLRKNTVNRYRYALNFGLNHPNTAVTPYVLMKEVKDANPVYLDSIYNLLEPEIAQSKYGKALGKQLGK
ncbi:MAG: DUF4369 domain-containing protein [Bacteroidota bacterium]